jgi:hypothetical protein
MGICTDVWHVGDDTSTGGHMRGEMSRRTLLLGSAGIAGAAVAGPVAARPAVAAPRLLTGRSGLPWNAGLYTGNGGMLAKQAAFARWRGRRVDSLMWFATRRSWDTMIGYFDPTLVDFPGLRIVSISSQPNGVSCRETASGARNAFWRNYGKRLADLGLDRRCIIRLNWEANIQSWGVDQPDPGTFVAAYRNVVRSIRSKAPRVRFTHGYSSGNWPLADRTWQQVADRLGPGEYFDYIEIDAYDHAPGARTRAEWRQQSSRGPGRKECLAYARSRGIYLWYGEWGPSWSQWAGGRDNPYYIERVYRWLQNNAVGNGGRIIGETTYNDDGAPKEWRHKLFDYATGKPTTYNQQAARRYRALWGS